MPRRYFIAKREAKALRELAASQYPWLDKRFKRVEAVELDDATIYIVDGEPTLLRLGDRVIPLINYLLRHPEHAEKMPRIAVDMGAAKAVMRGADLMVPGVRGLHGEFHAGDIVVVVDEKYMKPVMIGEALMDYDPVARGEVKRGKLVKNLHHAGDKYWRQASTL